MIKGKVKPIVFIVISYASGILTGPLLRVSSEYLWLGFIPFLVFLFFLKPKNTAILLLFVFFCLGFFRYQECQVLSSKDIYHVSKYYYKKAVQIKGVIRSDVEHKKFFNFTKDIFTLKVESVKSPWGWRQHSGKIVVHIFQPTRLAYGDLISIQGKLHQPYNFSSETNFSYEKFLKNKGIRLICSVKKNNWRVLSRGEGSPFRRGGLLLRKKFKKIFYRHLSVNEAGMMSAIVLGDRTGLPRHIKDIFSQTGTAHILAISGLHVGVVSFVIFVFLKLLPFSRKVQVVLNLGFLMGFCLVAGGRPSIIRATIMSSIFLLSFLLEREIDPMTNLSWAAFWILIYDPLSLFDVGFQLSFLSVLSIILLYPFFEHKLSFLYDGSTNKFQKSFWRAVLLSLSVWLGVAGIVAFDFHIITPITIIANLIVVPFMTLIVALGLALLVMHFFPLGLSIFFAICLKVLLNLMTAIVFLLSKIPFGCIFIDNFQASHVIVYYFLGMMIFFWLRSRDIRGKQDLHGEYF